MPKPMRSGVGRNGIKPLTLKAEFSGEAELPRFFLYFRQVPVY
jgi:hypothetical protein